LSNCQVKKYSFWEGNSFENEALGCWNKMIVIEWCHGEQKWKGGGLTSWGQVGIELALARTEPKRADHLSCWPDE
jgi:hypothetical protein